MRGSHRLDRGYERLTPVERFQLMIAAEGRADAAEADRLVRSCPRSVYRICDPAFSDRYDRAALLTIAVLSELGEIGRRIDLLNAAGYTMRFYFTTAADDAEFEAFCLTNEAQPEVRRAVLKQRGRCRRVYRRLREAALAEGASLAHAFVAVCRDELEVDPRELALAVAAPQVGLLDRFLCLSPDDDQVERRLSELRDAWRVGIGAQPARLEAKV
jgi:hypothetical protein